MARVAIWVLAFALLAIVIAPEHPQTFHLPVVF